MFTNFKTLVYGIVMNLIFLANIIWAFYRRGSDEIDHPFTGNNFLLIRALSIVSVLAFLSILRLLRLDEYFTFIAYRGNYKTQNTEVTEK